ncbi:unnamed protein product, partial [Ectocarpus sp. 12 AP-2014]
PATAANGTVANDTAGAQVGSAAAASGAPGGGSSGGGATAMEVDTPSPDSSGNRGKRSSGPPEVVIASPVVHLLATELSNYRHTVRSTAKRAIE